MSMEESISLEETNKIRVKLGLKPLTDDGPPADDKEKQAESNYARQREQEAKERETKSIQDKIAKIKNRHELNAKLKGATLGDADPAGEEEDTLKWIKKSKKREKMLAKKRMEELENMDRVFQGEKYTEDDLVGLKVSHDFEEMDEGDARILTLKDSRILDNEEDELQNVEMAEDERTKKNNELKIKKRDYTGYDDDEFAPGVAGMKRSVLAKYDEDINGVSETGFRLGSSSGPSTSRQKKEEDTTATVNKSLLSIDYAKTFISDDYLQEGDVGFKKPKTKKKRPSRRAAAEEQPAEGDAMAVDEKPIVPRERNLDSNFVDDDELQAALARSRRAKLQKPKKLSPEELAKKVAEQRIKEEESEQVMPVSGAGPSSGDGDGEGGLEFDETTEFVRAISYNPAAVKQEVKPEPDLSTPQIAQAPTAQQQQPEDQPMTEIEAGELDIKEEDDDADMAMLDAIEDALKAEDEAADRGETTATVGTSSEQTFSSGMASTLNILRNQGILAAPSADQKERERVQLQRDLWLSQQRSRVAQRELQKASSRGIAKDQATREYENRLRETQEARDTMEAYKNYKPDVNIVYYDDHGRALTPKEAWKALSHKFHGKGSGKMKTEKMLKKIAEERKMAAMQSGDTPLSMQKAFQMRQEKTGQAHFVLSVGNRGAVPQATEFLEPQPLSKGKTEKKNKKKEATKTSGQGIHTLDSGFITLPAPSNLLGSDLGSGTGTPMSGSPAPKPGFSRIGSAVNSPAGGAGTPVGDGRDRTKVAFGFGTKRKADGELGESPAAKSSRR